MVVGIVVLPFYLLVVIIIITIRIVIDFFPHLVRYQLIVDEIDRLKKTRLLKCVWTFLVSLRSRG